MKYFLTFFLYICTLLAFMQNLLLVAAIMVVLFSLRFGAVFFIPAAIMFDGYYGNFYTIPYLSLLAILWFVVSEYIRPKLSELFF